MKNDYLTSNAIFESTGGYITAETEIDCDIPVIRTLIKEAESAIAQSVIFTSIVFQHSLPDSIRNKVRAELKCEIMNNEEEYVIEIRQQEIVVYAESERGLLYGAATICRLAEGGFVRHGLIYNYPVCPVRGLKLYLPAQENIDYFKQYIDMLCRYQYNTVMLEAGGAMEYKKHPEINEAWVRHCQEMSEYNGKTVQIQQHTFPWFKNSMHVENGGGQFLSQDQVKDIVKYCKDRFLNVIPEVPSLSHCDYLLMNHPELAERKNDPYPDTYCPSDERSYELLFDVLEEVLEVFQPQIVNVGHDEYYSIGLCDKCKGKPAELLFAEDLRRIHDFLEERDVKTMIWCEKLINAIDRNGSGYGGAEVRMMNYVTNEYLGETIPPTYKAIDLIPQNMLMLHWYGGLNKEYDQLFLKRGMHMTFGNFDGPSFMDWKERLRQGAQGGIISNWSAVAAGNLQRNGILFSMAYSAYMFWRDDFDDSKYREVAELSFEALYNDRYRQLMSKAGKSSGTSYIEVLHTTDDMRKYRKFFDGIFLDNDDYGIGEYVMTYADGTDFNAPIYYGMNISNKDRSWNRYFDHTNALVQASFTTDASLIEASYTTLPVWTNEGTFYKWIIENPLPEKVVSHIRLIVNDPASYNIIVRQINLYPESSAFDARRSHKPLIRILGEGELA